MNGFIDLRAVATESPTESIAVENEIVAHIAHEHDYPEQPSAHPIEEQLSGLVAPEIIRSQHTWPLQTPAEATRAPAPRRRLDAVLHRHA